MGTHQKWDIGNLKDVNTNTTNLKLVEKLLLQGLFQYLDVYPLQKSMLFPIGSVLRFNHMKNENKIDKDEPPGIHITQDDPDYETSQPAISEDILNRSETGVTQLEIIMKTDAVCDCNIAIKDIIEYIKHLVRCTTN